MIGNKVKEEEFTIKNYVYLELEDQSMVVQSVEGIIKTQEERLKKFFIDYDTKNSRSITMTEMKNRFSHDTDEVLRFLKVNGFIERKMNFNLDVNKIKIFTDNEDVEVLLMNALKDSNKNIIFDEGNYFPEKNTLIIVFLNNYNKSLAKSIRDEFRELDDSYLLMTYTYNGSFYMDSLYLGALKMPCHICHISNIETNIRNSPSNSVTYQHILDSIYSEFDDISIPTPLDKSHVLNITTLITNKINQLITLKDGKVIYPENYVNSTMMNLKSKEILVDTPIHWELCDCYE